MSRHFQRRLIRIGFVLAMLGMLPVAPRSASAGLAALDAFHVGRYHLANGQREQALESFNDALRLNPQFVQAYIARGKLYAEMGQHESALVDLNFALRLQPTHAEAFAYRGYALLSLGQAAKAMPDLDMALRLDPSYARVHFLRGQALELLGDGQNSASSIALARRLDPTLDISQVVTASADGSLGSAGVQLAGGNTPQRTPVMNDLLPAAPKGQPIDPRYIGRFVPFEQHPTLADVAPPRMSQPNPDQDLSRDQQLVGNSRNAPRTGAVAKSQVEQKPTKPAVIPDLTSDPSGLAVELESPSSKAKSKSADAGTTPKTAVEQPIAVTMPAEAAKPDVRVEALPQQTDEPAKTPAKEIAKQDEAGEEGKIAAAAEEKADEDSEPRRFPSFGPPIFVMPSEGLASDGPAPTPTATEILRGAAGGLMLPEKPSSIDSDKRLQAAVEAAKSSAAAETSSGAMAVVGDEGEGPAVATKAEPTAEQLEAAKVAYRRATELEAAGKVSEALAAYAESAKLNPANAETFCRRGHLLLEEMRTAEALAEFEKAIAAAPGLANGYFGRAHVRYVTEQFVEAQFDYSICLRLDDQHAQALIERGHCFAQLGKTAEARADRRAALDLDPSLAKSGPKYAMDVMAAAIPTTAMQGATAFAGDDASTDGKVLPVADARAADAAAVVVSDEPSEAATSIVGEKSAFDNLFPAPEAVKDASNRSLPALSDADAAEAEIKKLSDELSQYPGDKDRYFRRARRYCDAGRLESAIDDLNAVLRFDAGSVDALKLRAKLHAELGNASAAAKDYSELLRQSPDDVTLLLDRSTVLAELGDVRAALADLDQVLSLDPKNAAAYLERSRLHAERGAFSDAQADRDQALKLDAAVR